VSNKAGELPYHLYAYDSYGAETGGEGDPTIAYLDNRFVNIEGEDSTEFHTKDN